ncbi:hypothetical protein BJ138DRAFT_1140143 [Hygrophoropsis aurantiaca]|uniref:Uncharacterized protein n=1 Tax=Hygrophoropsis aurantiaca TaxID=72124 RepID=A0ACB8ATH5_9AGAM|nr:hypothetical protein BJ138DRAFT_1140143 [Hygrophoropsis aurantiaca]
MEGIVDITFYSERRLALFRRIQEALDDLPVLDAETIPKDESCAICLTPFSAVLEECLPSQLDDVEGGVTKVSGCGHMFCRKDLSEWIKNAHGSCPTCRHPFLDIQPITDSDAESSDDDYIPEDDDEDEDDFVGLEDDIEFDVEEMDLDLDVDLDDVWEDAEQELEDEWRDIETSFTHALDEADDHDLSSDSDADPTADESGSTLQDDSSSDAK